MFVSSYRRSDKKSTGRWWKPTAVGVRSRVGPHTTSRSGSTNTRALRTARALRHVSASRPSRRLEVHTQPPPCLRRLNLFVINSLYKLINSRARDKLINSFETRRRQTAAAAVSRRADVASPFFSPGHFSRRARARPSLTPPIRNGKRGCFRCGRSEHAINERCVISRKPKSENDFKTFHIISCYASTARRSKFWNRKIQY